MIQTKRARGGFTLIELLVVISILAILSALVMAGVQRVRNAQMVRSSEDIVSKLQVGLDNQVSATVDAVNKEARDKSPEFNALLASCEYDAARAQALLLYCRMRQNFPQSAAELGPFGVAGVTFRMPPTFNSLVGIAGGPDEVSAAILYAALSQRTMAGNNFDSDNVTTSAQIDYAFGGGKQFRVYKDAWGNPVGFKRFLQSGELDRAPYAAASTTFKDPFDTQAKLANWIPAGNPTPNPKLTAQAAVGVVFDNRNKRPTVYSAGADRAYGTNDDILGYRLVKLGDRGFKP